MLTSEVTDVMTLNTRVEVGVPIVSIGVCAWASGKPIDIDHTSSQRFVLPRGQVDVDTLRWHFTSNPNATALFTAIATQGVELPEALPSLASELMLYSGARIWSHGSLFDIAILEWWYRRINISVPWSHRQVMDTRTIYAACGVTLTGNDQDAERDAINQAKLVQECWTRIQASKH